MGKNQSRTAIVETNPEEERKKPNKLVFFSFLDYDSINHFGRSIK